MFARSFVQFFLLLTLVGQLSAAPITVQPGLILPRAITPHSAALPSGSYGSTTSFGKPNRFAAIKKTVGNVMGMPGRLGHSLVGKTKAAVGRITGHRKPAAPPPAPLSGAGQEGDEEDGEEDDLSSTGRTAPAGSSSTVGGPLDDEEDD